jgi:hypothetical protein
LVSRLAAAARYACEALPKRLLGAGSFNTDHGSQTASPSPSRRAWPSTTSGSQDSDPGDGSDDDRLLSNT